MENLINSEQKGLKKMIKKIRQTGKKTKIILGFVLIVVLIIVGFLIFNKKEPVHEFFIVEKGNIIEEVSATGKVEAVEEVDLRFKTNGIVDKINVKVGDQVKKGAYLIQLASGEAYSQYLQAQASYNQSKAKLDQLMAGASTEQIKVAEQVVESTRISLEDAKIKAEKDLNQKYNMALSYLISSSSKCNKAITDMKDIEKTYFSDSSAVSKEFVSKRLIAEESFIGVVSFKGAQEMVETALEDPTHENIDSVLVGLLFALQKTISLLDYAKTATSEPTFIGVVSSTDKTTITTDAGEITAAFSNINTTQNDIVNQKVINQININSAENSFKKAELDLAELKAPPREVDIAVYRADVDRYRANVEEYSQRLKDASVIAPFDGAVAKIDVKIGEVVSAASKVVASLISPGDFQIRAEIPEADIRKLKTDNSAAIVLDAFPEEIFAGQVVEIEPGKTIIDGVVYYRIKILFETTNQKLKSGMSADVTVQTNKKENVLYVPQRAINYRGDLKFVRALKNSEAEEIEVETGIKGGDGRIEIISGLNEGQKIIVYTKK